MTKRPTPPACTSSRRPRPWVSRRSSARHRGIEYKVGKFPMSANGKALILNGGEGLVKIIAGKEVSARSWVCTSLAPAPPI